MSPHLVGRVRAGMLLLTVLVTISGCSSATSESPQPQGESTSTVQASDPVGPGDQGAQAKQSKFDGAISQWVDKLVTCLQADGWDVKAAPTGDGIIPKVTAAQQTAYDASHKRCIKKLGDPPGSGGLSEAELKVYYAWGKKTVACLRDHGWPAEDPPSFETYVQQVTGGQKYWDLHGPPWVAMGLVVKDPSLVAMTETIQETCPDSPR